RDRVLGQPRASSSLTRIAVTAGAAVLLELFLSVLDIARGRTFRSPKLLRSLPSGSWNCGAQKYSKNSQHEYALQLDLLIFRWLIYTGCVTASSKAGSPFSTTASARRIA